MDVRLPDGTIIRGVPDGTTKAELAAKLKANGYAVPDDGPQEGSRARAQKQSEGLLTKAALNLIPGAIRGAGSIGATLMAPGDVLNDAAMGTSGTNTARRQGIDSALQGMGADPTDSGYALGKITGEVAGTAGAGPAVAGLARATPLAAKAPGLISAIESGGMVAGPRGPGAVNLAKNVATRSAGGAVAGGAAAGMVDPQMAPTGAAIGAALPPAAMAAGYAGRGVAKAIGGTAKQTLGLTTGVGAEPLAQAYKAGKAGNKDFVANMRGEVPLTDVLDQAKNGLDAMRAAKSAEYRSGMIPIQNDKTVLSLSGIDAAVKDAAGITAFKGQVKNESAASAVDRMRAAVDEWRALDPAEFHTPEGLDALKQKLGGILESIPYQERTARLAAGKIYTATKDAIEKQAPAYAKVMREYSAASELVSEIERTLSLKPGASVDTAMRKLQSLMRNNVQTNYGNRLSLANKLEAGGGNEVMPALAGQAVNSWTPRSLTGQAGGLATAYMAAQNPLMLAALPFQSPRLVGNMAYRAGQVAGAFTPQPAAAAGQQLLGVPPVSLLPNALLQFGYRAAPVSVSSGGR